MGNTIADNLYKAGIQAAAGLIRGLNSQIAAITKEMTKIANALVAAIKKELGIRSPSTIMASIGRNTAQGFVNGYMQTLNANKASMAQASMFTPVGPSAADGVAAADAATGNTGPTKIITNRITVHTQEIDPRKTAAELGWDLAGRM
jgi:hypothetical protein